MFPLHDEFFQCAFHSFEFFKRIEYEKFIKSLVFGLDVCEMNWEVELSVVDHSRDFLHVDFDMVDAEFVKELFEEVFKIADGANLRLLAVEALIGEGDLWGVEHFI
jgi:hypothetical protein